MRRAGTFSKALAGAADLPLSGRSDISVDDVLETLSSRKAFTIFLDDAHKLKDPAAAGLMRLIELSPRHVRIVIGARSTAGLALARIRAGGGLVEYGAKSLAFTAAESDMLVAGLPEALRSAGAELATQARGWPAGLALGLSALRAGAPRSEAGVVADFFEEEVLPSLSETDRSFLIHVSLLDVLSAPCCNAVGRVNDSRQRLRRLEQAGIFLEPVESKPGAYALHPLFAAVLREKAQELGAKAVCELHRRASAVLLSEGEFEHALEHAAASDDTSLVAEFLEANCEEMTYQGSIPVVARHAEALPREVLDRLPKTLLTLAWLTTRQLRFDETQRLLDRARRRIDEMEQAGDTPDSQIALLRLMLKHRQTVLATAKDDEMGDVDSQSEDLLKELGDTRPYLTCTLYGQMLTARYTQYRLEDFSRIEPSARSALSRSGYRFAAIGLQAVLGIGLWHAGRTQAAREALEQALSEANRISGPNSGQAALAALPLSRILYEGDERDAADALIHSHLPVAREFGFPEQLMSGYLTLNRLRLAEGDVDGALSALEEAKSVAVECNLTRLSMGASSERIRIWLRNGRPDLALREGRREGLDVQADAVSPSARSTQSDEIRAMAWTRLAASRDRMNDALIVTRRWRHFCLSRGAIRTLVRWAIITAHICGARGDVAAAKRALHDALLHAADGRFYRSFIDEGPFIQKLIGEGYAGAVDTNDPTELFARDLLSRYPNGPSTMSTDMDSSNGEGIALFGPLNTREVEILRLVGCGLRNSEIGVRLGLTEGTVKWYMQQIYDKVGVRRRPQAVERARQLGVLH